MIRFLPVLSLLAVPAVSVAPAMAASFDCAKATTPFEQAICGNDGLGEMDERLARTYSFALAGLSETAAGLLKQSQQAWLGYAQKACTDENEAILSGAYDERMLACLSMLYASRVSALEQSRIYRGQRLYPVAQFASAPDSYRNEEPDFYWPVGQHEMSVIQLDSAEPYAEKLNAALRAEAEARSTAGGEMSDSEENDVGGEDTGVVIDVQGGFWEDRMSFTVETSWYPHGAAHGGHTTTYLHYLGGEERFARSDDLFDGEAWKSELTKLVSVALEQQLGDILFPDAQDTEALEGIVTDISRWDFSNYRGVTIQFQPYEVTAYVYGAPTIFISWEALEPFVNDGAALH